MKTIVSLCLFFIGIVIIHAIPHNDARSKRNFGRQPLTIREYRRSAYFPQGVMTAYANGDMISANSFMGEQPPITYYQPQYDNAHRETQEAVSDLDLPELNSETGKDQATITSTEKSIKQKPELNKDDNEDEDNHWPFGKSGNRGFPNYNAFFPIMIGGGYSNNRERRTEEGGYPGAATAIANSFSTGKGGVASSHAVAYGDPYLSTLLRNGNGLNKRVNPNSHE